MRELNSESVDLIYADPPFGTNSIRQDSDEPRNRFDDRFADMNAYLDFLKPRLVEMHRLLSHRGSLFVHTNWRSAHHVRVLLDGIFGPESFLNEIIWVYRGGGRPANWLARKHDLIFWYAKSFGLHTFNRLRDGAYRTEGLKLSDNGVPFKVTRNGPIHFHADGPSCSDVWEIPMLSTVSRERCGYPTQKSERLLERMIVLASNEGDLVGDFFCGSGTTLVAAKRLNRRWIGCDKNPRAITLTKRRLHVT